MRRAQMTMTPTTVFRSTAAVALAAVVLAAACVHASAGTPSYGSIGLYVDEGRTSNTVSYAGTPFEFTMYVFCRPGEHGLIAAEFGIAYPANVVPATVTENPLISISLGDLDSGISAAFFDCQNDWVWTHHQTVFLMSAAEAHIEVEKNGASHALQFATCELGFPLEPVHISSAVFCNTSCEPDTVPPLLLGARSSSRNGVDLAFSEVLLEGSAEDPLNYEIAEASEPFTTLPVGDVALLADERTVRLLTPEPFIAGGIYTVRAHGVFDRWGNEIPPGSERTFIALDLDPPELVSASAAGLTSLTAVFNEAVDPATAGNQNNYRLYYYIDPESPERDVPCPYYPETATLASPCGVLLGFYNLPVGRTVILRVTNVGDIAGNVITKHNTANFFIEDVYPPALSFVAAVMDSALRIVFSEPVTDLTASVAANYEVFKRADTLSTVPVVDASLHGDMRVATIRLGARPDSGKSYLLRAHGISDFDGNTMFPPTSIEFVALDFLSPVPLSATAPSRYLIRIAFDEPLEKISAETALNYQVYETVDATSTIPVSGAELEQSSDVVRLDLGAALVSDLSYTVRIREVRDLRRNAIVSASITTVCPVDSFPPSFTGVTPVSETQIELAFDETLRRLQAEDELNYLLFETDAPSRVVAISAAALAENGSRVQLSLSANLVLTRSYTVSVSNLVDLEGNVIPPGASRVFVFSDAVSPRLLRARSDENLAVVASFSERLDAITAQNTHNYHVFETNCEGAAIPITGAVLADDSASVRLSLGVLLESGTPYSLRVSGVTDRGSNPVPDGSVVPITVSDAIPPLISAVEVLTSQYVTVIFDEPVTASTAGDTVNYLLIPLTDPGESSGPFSVDILDDRTAGLSFTRSLAPGQIYTLQVSGVTDLAGNEIPTGSWISFVCPGAPTPGSGCIGLFVEADRGSCRVNCTNELTPFKIYVWCLAGSTGQIAVEFKVVYPENVIRSAVTMNPIVTVTLGNLENGLSAALSECNRGWEWIAAQDCYLMSTTRTAIDVGSGPIAATCSPGYPLEIMQILSRISCNGGPVGTLLQGYAAFYKDRCIGVAWRLSERDDGVRFSISRKEGEGGEYSDLSGEVAGDGLSFSYRDEGVEPGKAYRYRVRYTDESGIHVLFESDLVAVPPLPLTLSQNWPNPFNPSTTITYYLPQTARVRLEIYDVSGRLIARLVNGMEERGYHTASWNGSTESGRPAAPGLYLYRLTAGHAALSRKMVLIR
jgi:hypothetical protein